jgi:hypothetical protein
MRFCTANSREKQYCQRFDILAALAKRREGYIPMTFRR